MPNAPRSIRLLLAADGRSEVLIATLARFERAVLALPAPVTKHEPSAVLKHPPVK